MKKVGDYRKIMGVTKAAGLDELKTIYRNFMKEFHPDKFAGNEELLKDAEEKSKLIIESYHFLVSIAPETLAKTLPEYTQTITTSAIADIRYTGTTLRIDFFDGSAYEYFDVPRNTYVKLVNADSQGRFGRRHIYTTFTYRNVLKSSMVPA
jgi:curved DNA-binding protein CbpA